MDEETSRARTGPRHAAPRKPLFTRFHVPTGKAIALAAMPTAVLMGLGFTPTLALADGNDQGAPSSNSLTADEYKACVEAMADAEKDASESPEPSPSATDDGKQDETEPSASPSAGDTGEKPGTDKDASSSSDSGSDDKDDKDDTAAGDNAADGDKSEPAPSPSASEGRESAGASAAEPSPSESEKGGLLEGIGDAIEGIFTGGEKAEETASPSPTPSASQSAGDDASDVVKETTDKVTGTVKDTVDGATDAASKAAEDTKDTVDKATEDAEKAAEEAKDEVTASPSASPSESAAVDPEDCPAATDEEGGVDNTLPVPEDPWYLEASSLTLKGASYKGIVEVKTASGATKKVLKYVISKGTDIGDLHQIVKDDTTGRTHHVQAAKGSTSTIRDGDTVMYTESISGNLLGLIPITFDPKNPPPLDIPLIYFTNVKVVQAGQFGGTLHVPGLHQYITD
ncbi:membrane-bound hydrophilic protein [Streptomyces sp. WM6391]|nr:membrane-bound hydrophilic protein [Streptomyces sp. WM6391]